MAENDVENELLDYEEDEEPQGAPESAAPAGKKEVKGSYVSIHSSGFRDFLLKPELLRAIIDCGFEHPSEGERHLSHHHHWLCANRGWSNMFPVWFEHPYPTVHMSLGSTELVTGSGCALGHWMSGFLFVASVYTKKVSNKTQTVCPL